jgi:hypothetical protein
LIVTTRRDAVNALPYILAFVARPRGVPRSGSVTADRDDAARSVAAWEDRRARAIDPTGSVAIRRARDTDLADVERLAALESRPVPSGPMLVAERDGRILAALATGTGETVADPFQPTADLVSLLALRAEQLRSTALARTSAARHSYATRPA